MTGRALQCWIWITWAGLWLLIEAWLGSWVIFMWAGIGGYWTTQLKIHNQGKPHA